MSEKKFTILGQDWDVIVAVFANILSWFVRRFFPNLLPLLLPKIDEEDTSPHVLPSQTKCVAIGRPGGQEQLRMITLKPGYATCGYNIDNPSPFIDVSGTLPPKTVVVRVHSFSINYADCCIRWGLYESANKFVGWPIVPGFDIAGIIERVAEGDDKGEFQVGDQVYGATFFGAYSTRVLVPSDQLRKIPSTLTLAQAASLPTACLTALYSLYLGGQYPPDLRPRSSNRSMLIHSAAGGVGSMLIQMSKLLGMKVVGVVGGTAKVDTAKSMGCDVVIDKSQDGIWKLAQEASPQGYAVIADANGVSTLKDSYDHLAPTGRLIVFGFHSNLPMGNDMLHPLEWLGMMQKMMQMPKFNPMKLTTGNKSLMGFNLSFFVEEIEMLGTLYDQISKWFQAGELQCPRIVEMNMTDIASAHELIQSGKSVGKIVLLTKAE